MRLLKAQNINVFFIYIYIIKLIYIIDCSVYQFQGFAYFQGKEREKKKESRALKCLFL